MTPDRYPLSWPTGQPRTKYRQDAAFKVAEFTRIRDELLHAVSLLGGRDVILSTNVAIRLDGLPYANMAEPLDPGVAIYFDRAVTNIKRPFVIACDTYRKVKWNMRAIWATVEALRSIQRHGASSMLEQAFTGFAALPPASTGRAPWWDVLGVPQDADAELIRRVYRDAAMTHHPDRGGDSAVMAEINRAYREALGGLE